MAMSMPPPPGMRGMGRPLGPRGFLTEEEKLNKPKITKELIFKGINLFTVYEVILHAACVCIIIGAAFLGAQYAGK